MKTTVNYLRELIQKETKLSEELYITRRQIDNEIERRLEELYKAMTKVSTEKPEAEK